jgi:hypothetical protein
MERMQLRYARLCLNCEEIHTASHCPVCASESFAYVSRWIPPGERRTETRKSQQQQPQQQQPPPSAAPPGSMPVAPNRMRWVKRGAAGVAVVAASRILWQLSRPVEWTADTADELEQREPDGGDEQ